MLTPDPTILDLLPELICVIERDYTITFANRTLVRLCGGEKKIIGRKCHEVNHHCPCPCAKADLPQRACPHSQVFATGCTVRRRHIHRLADGETRVFDITSTPVPGPDGRPIQIVQVMRDITDQARAERCLEETAVIEEIMATVGRLLLAGSDLDRISSLILQEAMRFTDSPDGVVLFQPVRGHRLTALICKGAEKRRQEITTSAPLGQWLSSRPTSLRANAPKEIPQALQPVGGPRRQRLLAVPVQADATPIGLILLADRPTDYSINDQRFVERLADLYGLALVRRQQEIQIERAKQEWERTFDAIQDVVTLQDKAMRIIRANKATSRIFGLTPPEIIGRTCHELFHGSPTPCPECPIAEVFAQGKDATAQVFHEKLGKTFLVSLSPIFDEDGKVTGFAHFARDITTEKNLEAQLRQAQKMEAIGRLAGGVAHDFNNVLTVIQGFLGIAEHELEPDSKALQALEQVKEGARRGADLVRQLLLFSRKKPMERQPVDCNRAIASLQKMIRRVIGEDIAIETDFTAEPTIVLGDPASIDQIIMNLAVNARDAMPEGGTLTLATSRFTANPTYCSHHIDARPGEYVCIAVSDTGVGMDPQTRERIFEPFFTTKEEGRGTGLGLSVVYGIVKEHGGWITCDSEPGNGAVFQVFLPVYDQEGKEVGSPAFSQSLRQGQRAGGRGERVLVVEDEEVVRQFSATALGSSGYTVSTAATAAEARQILDRSEFDLLFVDAVLPDGHGDELAEKELQRRSATKILLTSGYPDQTRLRAALHRHGWPFLQKPYTMEGLLAAVDRALRQRP